MVNCLCFSLFEVQMWLTNFILISLILIPNLFVARCILSSSENASDLLSVAVQNVWDWTRRCKHFVLSCDGAQVQKIEKKNTRDTAKLTKI